MPTGKSWRSTLLPAKKLTAVTALLMLACAAVTDEFQPLRALANELSWSKVEEKVWFAPISGSESTPGMYVYRVRFLKSHRNEPHFHTDDRVVTVMSGSLLVGFGENVQESKMKELREGDVYTEPKNTPHYVWAKDGEVELQVVGSGLSRRISVSDAASKDQYKADNPNSAGKSEK